MFDFRKNVPGWVPTEKDYRLIFRPDSRGMWREITCNLPKYQGVLLADYLADMNITIPDGCTFCRIGLGTMRFEYRAFGSGVCIDVDYR